MMKSETITHIKGQEVVDRASFGPARSRDMKCSVDTGQLELKALYEISRLIGSALDLEKTLTRVLGVLHETLRMERATLVLLHKNGRHLTIRASYGLTKEEELRGVYRIDEGVTGKIFQTKSPFVVPDIHSEPLFLDRTKSRSRITKETISFIGVPVLLQQEPVGVLTVDRLFGPEISFEEDIRFLSVVATLIAQFLDLHNAVTRREETLKEENRNLKAELHNRFSRKNIVGNSKALREVFSFVAKVAPSSATVLLLGESGTGKELVARAIHEESPRSSKPFVKVNCAALPETLLESELFGHEKGAFTGAFFQRIGRFELAHEGTLFLDEIGELPLALQAKLLRVLQEKQFERLGGSVTIDTDVHLIAATNRPLDKEVAEGRFRADLYYRLNVVPILLPPLRHRREDIPPLVDYFLDKSNRRNKRSVRVSREVLDFMLKYPWPGNVRELENLIERLVIMADNDLITMDDIPSYMLVAQGEKAIESHAETCGPSFSQESHHPSLRELEKREIIAALKRHGWIQARAARELGLTQRQIGYKIKKYGIKQPGRQ